MIKLNNSKILFYISLSIIFIVFFFPFFWIISSSIKSPEEIISKNPTYFPLSFTIEHYYKLLITSDMLRYLLNSLIVSFSSMIISVILSLLAAYGLHKLKFYGNQLVEQSLLVIRTLLLRTF